MLGTLRHNWKKTIATTMIVIAGGVAYAYWTQSGSGSGTATSGNGAAITINQTSTVSGLYPGASGSSLSGNFSNPNGGPAYVTSISATISSVTGPNITGGTPCDATDYTLSGFPVSIGRNVPAGNNVDSWSGGSIAMNNKASTNQNGCKGATVNISYTSN